MSDTIASMKENLARHLLRRADDPTHSKVQGAAHDGVITKAEATATLENGFFEKALADGFDALIIADAARQLTWIETELTLRRPSVPAPRAPTLAAFAALVSKQLESGSFSEADYLRLRRAAAQLPRIDVNTYAFHEALSYAAKPIARALLLGRDYATALEDIDAGLVHTFRVENFKATVNEIISQLPATGDALAALHEKWSQLPEMEDTGDELGVILDQLPDDKRDAFERMRAFTPTPPATEPTEPVRVVPPPDAAPTKPVRVAPPPARDRLPYNSNAASVFLPAIEAADQAARAYGHRGLTYEGSGIRARGGPFIDAIELQTIVLVTADGRRLPLGAVLPEGEHLRELKSTAELTKEIVALIPR